MTGKINTKVGDEWALRNGTIVRICAINEGMPRPIVGGVDGCDDEEWYDNGKYALTGDSPLDLHNKLADATT